MSIKIKRTQKEVIIQDLKRKMVFLVGPRQVGKTYLAKEIMQTYKKPIYLNYDTLEGREIIKKQNWDRDVDFLVFDEIHKMPKWKNYLKGVFDFHKDNIHILVTGSARLETFRQAGDSLAGRFLVHHLLPFSLKELEGTVFAKDMNRLIERGGFPEPFLAENEVNAKQWRDYYVDSLMRVDVLDFKDINKFNAMRQVFDILRTKIGSNISYNNIARDVGISPITVKKYIEILEALYIIFIVKPYSKKIGRAILKSPKIYFFDTGLVVGDAGVVLENFVAVELLKQILLDKDLKAENKKLVFLKDKEGREVDFGIVKEDGEMEKILEVKMSERGVATQLKFFQERYDLRAVQLVKNLDLDFSVSDKLQVRNLKNYLLQ